MPETCARTLPQVMSPKCLRPWSLRQFLEVLWKTFINYTMYRENLENMINKLREVKSRHKAHSITRCRDVLCRENVLTPVPDALRRVCGKHCGLWSRRWRVTKMLTSPLYAQKASEELDAMVVQERGKCTIYSSRSKGKIEVSFIWRSESFGRTRCIVFCWTGKPDQEFCVQKS